MNASGQGHPSREDLPVSDTTIVQFPDRGRFAARRAAEREAEMIAKMTVALEAMRDVHAELERLKAKLRSERDPA